MLDIIYHAELGLDEHIDALYRENDMDPRRVDSGTTADGVAVDGSGAWMLPGDAGAEGLPRLTFRSLD